MLNFLLKSLKMCTIKLKRTKYLFNETLGEGQVGDFKFVTLELPWKNNQRKVSCIPPGTYKGVKRTSPKYGLHVHILDVPGRDLILMHNANYVTQLEGCVAVGEAIKDINADGTLDVTNSVKTLKKLVSLLPDSFTIVIE